MSRIRANTITNQNANGAPNFPDGITVSGVVTATTTSQNITGDLSVTGNIGVGGTLTYEDVTNIDSVGVITARSDINLGDSIIHIGDTDTKIRFPSADTIQFETGGTQRVTINNTTGVNTLDIVGGIRANHFVGRSNISTPTADVSIYRAADNTLEFATASTPRLRIPSAGGIELKTDGRGVKFPDTQTPTNAYTSRVGVSSEMRYYETGTFEVSLTSTVLNSLQNPAFTDASYASRIGRYVRVGHLCFVNFEIRMAGSVTYAGGSTSTAPVCVTGCFPFRYSYNPEAHPEYNPVSIWYNGSGYSNDTFYACAYKGFPGPPYIQLNKPGSSGVWQYNSTSFGECFAANHHVAISFCYPIDLDNADY